MKHVAYLSTLFNADIYVLNNGDVYLKVAGTMHLIGTTSNSTIELKAEADIYA